MKVIIQWCADQVERDIKLATQSNDVGTIRKIGQAVENANKVWESWATANDGSVVAFSGPKGSVEVPAEYINEVKKIQEQYGKAVSSAVSVGIGIKPDEADIALRVAQGRDPDSIVVYSDACKEELEAREKEKDPLVEVANLQKVSAPPEFPKLGIENRRETKLIKDPKELRTNMQLAMHSTNKGDDPVELRNAANLAASKVIQGKSGLRGGAATKHGGVIAMALSGKLLRPEWRGQNEKAAIGTKNHEDLHLMFARVEKEHGPEARRNLAENLYNAIPKQHRPNVDRLLRHFAGDRYEKHEPHFLAEERLARVINHMNSPADRQAFHQSGNQLEDDNHRPERFDTSIKQAHRAMLAAAETANPNWLKSPTHIAKAEAMNEGPGGGFEGMQAHGQAARHIAPESGAADATPTEAAQEAAEAVPAPEMTHSAQDFENHFHDLAEAQEGQDQADQKQAAEQDSNKEIKAKVVQILQVLKQQAPVLEQMQQSAPETYQAVMAMTQAVIQMAKQLNGDHPQTSVKEVKDRAAAAPVQKNEQSEGDWSASPKTGAVLDKAAAPPGKRLGDMSTEEFHDFIRQNYQKKVQREERIKHLTETTHGSAWKTPTGSVVVSPDQHDLSRWRATPIKEGGVPEQHIVSSDHAGALRIAHEMGADLHGQPIKYRPIKPPAPVEKASLSPNAHPKPPSSHHHVVLPVGSQIDTHPSGTRRAGYVKVHHPETDADGWVSVRAGQILSGDSHAISAKNPEGK